MEMGMEETQTVLEALKKGRPLSRQRGNGRALPASAGALKQVTAALLEVDGIQGPRPVFFNKLCSQLLGRKEAKPSAGPACQVFIFQEEDDWKEFEQKEEIDYSGLRVQSMQISEKEEDESEKREEPGDSWEETGGGVDRSSGPWNKSAPAPAPVVEPIVTEPPEPVQTGGVYRPPGAREGGRPRRAQQGPPEIYSDTQFPSLQSTAKLVDSRKDKEMEKSFEVVKHKTRGRDEVSKNQALKLQLDNQYAVLGDQ